MSRKHRKKKVENDNNTDSGIPRKFIIIGWVVSLIGALVGGGLLSPWFAEFLRPKPDVYFVKESCAIVPTGTNVVLIKLVVKNRGQTEESSLQLRVIVNSPYVILNTTENYYGRDMATLSAGEACMDVIPVENPNMEVIQHGSIEVNAKVVGIKVWDSYTFSESW